MDPHARLVRYAELPLHAQLRVFLASVLGVCIVLALGGAAVFLVALCLRELFQTAAVLHGFGDTIRTVNLLTLAASAPLALGIFHVAFVWYLRWFVHTPLGGVLPRYYRMSRGKVQRSRLKYSSRLALRASVACCLFAIFVPVHSLYGALVLGIGLGTWVLFMQAGSEEILYELRPAGASEAWALEPPGSEAPTV